MGELVSPRLSSLQRALHSGGERALAAFWEEVAAEGTPLVEPDPADGDFSFVTFLWRETEETASVSVHVPVDGSGRDEHGMARLAGTDLWYATYRLRNDYRAAYKFVVRASPDPVQAVEQPDPLNPHTFVEPQDEERPDHAEDDVDSVVRLPAAPPRPWTAPRPDVEQGSVERYLFHSPILDNERRVWVYTPPHYQREGDPYDLLIVLDGRFFTFALGAPAILDKLVADDEIRPLVAVMVDNPGDTWEQAMAVREREFGCHPPFSESLAREIVPWCQKRYHVTGDPRHTVIAGGSAGGLAAAFAALQYHDTFGNVLSLSGSFWWKPDDEDEWEWLSRQVASSALLPIRFYVEVGLLESKPTSTGFPGQILSNRHLRNVLQAKGYDVHYDEQMHGHDSMPWQGAFAEGLRALQPAATGRG